MKRAAPALLGGLLVAACGGSSPPTPPSIGASVPRIVLTSPAFVSGGRIPRQYTCDGRNVSPPLRWSGVPSRATQLYVVMLDRGVSGGTVHHWAIRFSAAVRGLVTGEVPAGAVVNSNDLGSSGYAGPCPPHGASAHHYLIGISALAGNTLVGYGVLTGTYARR